MFADHEVNVNDCEQWFPLIKLRMGLDSSPDQDIHMVQDRLCMTALKSSIENYKVYKDAVDGTITWHLQPTNNSFLQSVLNLVSHMYYKERILFLLYFVANYAPPGADQVEAIQECYKFVQENFEELRSQTRTFETCQKVIRKYAILKIQHLLHLFGLNDERYMKLIESPRELIAMLYTHEAVVTANSKTDINHVSIRQTNF